jgi:hypothetical protein
VVVGDEEAPVGGDVDGGLEHEHLVRVEERVAPALCRSDPRVGKGDAQVVRGEREELVADRHELRPGGEGRVLRA